MIIRMWSPKFGNNVDIIIYDVLDRASSKKIHGWDNLAHLKWESGYDAIKQKLTEQAKNYYKQRITTSNAESVKQGTDNLLVTSQTESMVSWMNRVMESGKKMMLDDNYRKKIAKRHF